MIESKHPLSKNQKNQKNQLHLSNPCAIKIKKENQRKSVEIRPIRVPLKSKKKIRENQ